MEFRMLYSGQLLATRQNNRRTPHKDAIRKAFHPQLKRLWEVTPHLDDDPVARAVYETGIPSGRPHTIESLSKQFNNFVPLVTRDLKVYCELNILFLRSDPPGHLVQSGDMDNRLNTLFDSLCIPRERTYVACNGKQDVSEIPFFCLLEDDSLITKLSLETDILINQPESQSTNYVHLVITVSLRPITLTMANMNLA